MKYQITKKQCQKMIGDRICSGCGGRLIPFETVDNANQPTFWAVCKKCSVYDWGVNKKTFFIAEKMVKENNFVCYSYMDTLHSMKTKDEKDYWYSSQIRGTCGIVAMVLKINGELNRSNHGTD